MARKLGTTQAIDLATFVRQLYAAGKFASWADFAREAGFQAPNLSKVKNGNAGIDGTNLLLLIQASARRAQISEEAASVLAARSLEAEASTVTLERRLQEVSVLAAEGFARLEAGIEAVVRRLDDEERPGRQSEETGP